ncbi:MAG TPA: FAD-dependent oxidoreductase [Solirubrobacteraceae bacterium]
MEAFVTERLIGLRPEPAHLAAFTALLADPEVGAWLRPPPLPPFAPDDPADLLRRDIEHWERHGFGAVVLADRATGEALGRGGLAFTTATEEFAVELPWALPHRAWGRGLATEAARAALAWARDLGLPGVISLTLPDNRRSRRVMEKAGLVLAGEIEHAGLHHVLYRARLPAPAETTVPVWLDPPAVARPALASDLRCEVCVVGGGMGGIATAWQLAAAGVRDIVILDAGAVAGGASGRNGGFLIAGAAPMYHRTRDAWGRERARRIYAATLAGQAALRAAAAQAGVAGAIRVTGLLRVGMDAAEADDVAAHHAALAEDGFAGELLEGDELPAPLRRPDRRALLTPHDGGMDPAAVVRGLAAELERRGVRIFERTPAQGPPGADGSVRTAAGRVRAERTVVAVDAQLGALVPAAAGVRSRRLNALATAPVAAGHLPRPLYMRDGYEYALQRADGRIVLGGFSDVDGAAGWTADATVSAPAQLALDAFLRDELGVTAPVTHRWAGLVGYAEDPVPRCGVVPGSGGRVLALGGYNGTGNVQAWVAGRIVSELLREGASADAALYAPVAGA